MYLKKNEFEKLLEKCSLQLGQGVALEAILRDHPDQAERFKPLLQAAISVQARPDPYLSRAAQDRGRKRLLHEADQLISKDHFQKNGTKSNNRRYLDSWAKNIGDLLFGKKNSDMRLLPRLAIYILATVLVAGFVTVNASASSLPGDPLYALKLNWEEIQKAFAFSEKTRIELEFKFDQERLEEVELLIRTRRIEKVKFSGQIEARGEFTWIVGGITLTVGPETIILGEMKAGDIVEVEAVTQEDGSLFAFEIELEDDDDDLDDDSDDDDLDADSDDDDLDDDSDIDSDDHSDNEEDDDEQDGEDDDEHDEEDE
jgi:hypothetical protein